LGLVACAVFKTVERRLRRLWWVRFPHAPATKLRIASVVVLLALTALPAVAAAQLPVPNQPRAQRDTSGRDTIPVPQFRFPPPTPPLLAMARSMLVPGWGQAVLHRRVTGGVLVFWEGLSLTMTLKASNELGYLRRTGADTLAVRLKNQEVQDWVVVLVFNHLMAGAEAFVSAELWDFPLTLQARALPQNRLGVGPALYWGR
jgi:hypothetical protein